MKLTRKRIDALYRQAVLRLDLQWWGLKSEFGEAVAKSVYQQKLDRITETYRLRVIQLV